MCDVCIQLGLIPSVGTSDAGVQTSRQLATAQYISALNGGETWGGNFGQAASVIYSFGFTTEGGALLGAAARTAATSAMQAWSNVANITFTSGSTSAAKLSFSQMNLDSMGAAGYAASTSTGSQLLTAEVVIDREYTTFTPGNFAYTVMLHEIGHAIGLKHPGNYSGSEIGPFLPEAYDKYDMTVMSYNGGTYISTGAGPVTPMLYDIAALQYLYGANTSYNSGNTTYAISGSSQMMTIWDGGGNDIITAAPNKASLIDLREGEAYGSQSGATYFWIAFNAGIENARGDTQDDELYGNSGGNALYGGGQHDYVDGKDGSDTIFGGVGEYDPFDGNDTLAGGLGADTVYGNAGNDLIYGGRAVADPDDGSDLVYGGKGTDLMYGNAGNDTLYGGGSAADPLDQSDTIYGGYGADLIFGNGSDDFIYGGGSVADPTDLGDTIWGGLGNDQIFGNGGNDVLYGQEGNDSLHGGLGNDSYMFDHGSGRDTVLLFEGAGGAGGDVIQLIANINGSGITTQAAALARTTYAGGAATIDLGGGHSITIVGVSSLVTDDFSIFSF